MMIQAKMSACHVVGSRGSFGVLNEVLISLGVTTQGMTLLDNGCHF